MTIADYLADLRRRRRRLMHEARKSGDIAGLLLLRQWKSAKVCCSPHRHRHEWYYAGQQHFVCAICERIKVA